jgi:3-deoxy-D-manno-octulosonic acid kinase
VVRKIAKSGTSVIVYDDRLIDQLRAEMFSADFWPHAETVPGYSGGRGATLFVDYEAQKWVLKHYHRGGMVSRWLEDGFLWVGLDSTRSVIEFDLLREMVEEGLPAPIPVAAHVKRVGARYTADLITLRIPDVVPFSTRLAQGPASEEVWRGVGQCVGEFHARGYFHADLSTHNLQIDPANRVYLLDWDRGRGIAPGNWRQKNLDRLQRSCLKISKDGAATYTPDDWQAFLAGYRSVMR